MVCEHRCAVICCRQTGISKTRFCCLFLDFPVRDCFTVKMGLKHRDFHRTKIRVVTMMRTSICCCLFAFFLGCNITAGIKHEIIRNKESVTLRCPPSVEGKVTWSRENRGRIVDILTADGNRETRHINDTRFTSSADQWLIILRPAASDSGAYLCNNQPAVQLTVISPGKKTTTTTTRRPNTTISPQENPAADHLCHMTVRTLIGLLCLIIMISITAVTWRKAGQMQKQKRDAAAESDL